MTAHLLAFAARTMRAVFAYLAACTLIADGHPVRRIVVTVLIAIGTASAVRVQDGLK